MGERPTLNGRNGRGQFVKGNDGGPGNPHSKKSNQLKAAMMSAVSDDDITEVIDKLKEVAKGGDVQAIKLLLDRVVGADKHDTDTDQDMLEAASAGLALLLGRTRARGNGEEGS